MKIGTLPARLLALKMGADIVYSEELIDYKLGRCIRKENKLLNTIDFYDDQEDAIVFRTCKEEEGKVVLQIGTSDADRAVKVAKLVEKDVAAIDVNMGCPKSFSVAGGMGVALAANIENAKKILKALKNAVNIPITCKIRIKNTAEETISHVKELVTTGISAIAIHARNKNERPQHSPHPEIIKAVVESNIGIPVICNGGSKEITKHSDIQKYKDACGASSIMLARAAEWNSSIFRKEGLIPKLDVVKMYLKYAIDYDNTVPNTKYNIQNILQDLQDSEQGRKFLSSETMEQICEVFDLKEYYLKKQEEFQKKIAELREQEPPAAKKLKMCNGNDSDIIYENVIFIRSNYAKDADLPKSIIHLYANKNFNCMPKFTTERKGSQFKAVLHLNGKKYSSSNWDKNKKSAEQSACLAGCLALKILDRDEFIANGSLDKFVI